MKFGPNKHQHICDVIRDEMEGAVRRIEERISLREVIPLETTGDRFEEVRRFYEDLADKAWTKSDEDYLISLGDMDENDLKQMMREGFRRSPVYPVPNFASLINVMKKGTGDMISQISRSGAISAAERERLFNLLADEMAEAAIEIASRLNLNEAGARLLREHLETAQGAIISRFTPLV